MQYLGGKARIGRDIADAMGVPASATYYEPFCGMLGVLRHVRCRRRVASDARLAVVTFWRAVQRGWVPPHTLSEKEYAVLRAADDQEDPRTAWAASGCSFGGKWWGGRARDQSDRNYAAEAAAFVVGVARDVAVEFIHRDYADLDPEPGAVVYCDPPYAGTTDYPDVGPFDHAAFWRRAEAWSASSTVYVSEFTGPPSGVRATDIWATRRHVAVEGISGTSRRKVDRLYLLGGAVPAQPALFARAGAA